MRDALSSADAVLVESKKLTQWSKSELGGSAVQLVHSDDVTATLRRMNGQKLADGSQSAALYGCDDWQVLATIKCSDSIFDDGRLNFLDNFKVIDQNSTDHGASECHSAEHYGAKYIAPSPFLIREDIDLNEVLAGKSIAFRALLSSAFDLDRASRRDLTEEEMAHEATLTEMKEIETLSLNSESEDFDDQDLDYEENLDIDELIEENWIDEDEDDDKI